MKYFSTIIGVVLFIPSMAQWEVDPLSPPAVCSEIGEQSSPSAYPDGEGGMYIMWLDGRTDANSKDIYGQHYNAFGEKLWEEQGRLLVDIEKNIPYFRFYRYTDGRMILAWNANTDLLDATDGIYVREINEEGGSVWAEDLQLNYESSEGALSAFYYIDVQILRLDDQFMTLCNITTYGYIRMRISGFDDQGELIGIWNGTEIGPLSYGYAVMTTDYNNAAYIYYSTGNGLGAAMNVCRVGPGGVLLWPEWVTVTEGVAGLGYQFGAVSDENGIVCIWEINQTDIIARRISQGGAIEWNEPLVICNEAGSSNLFNARRQNDEITIVWRDSRPGVNTLYAVYAQRFTTSGEVLWADDGVEVADLGSYDPQPVLSFSDEGSILVMHICHQNGIATERVHKTLSDGSKGWGDEGITIAEGSNFVSIDRQKGILASGNRLIGVWRGNVGFPAGSDIHVSLIETLTVYQQEDITACNFYAVAGQVFNESGTYEIQLAPDTLLTLNLTIEEFIPSVEPGDAGLLAFPEGAVSYSWIDCNSGEFMGSGQLFTPQISGLYAATVSNESCSITTDCIYFPVYTYIDSTVYACDYFLLDGIQIDESGTFTLTLPGDTILNLNIVIEELSAGFTQNGNMLEAYPDNADSYEWTDCDTGEMVGSEQLLEITSDGNYSCTIGLGACTVETDCVGAIYTSLGELEILSLKVFPNPGSAELYIEIPENSGTKQCLIKDITGRNVFESVALNGKTRIETESWPPGLYTVYIIQNNNRSGAMKWVKQ